MLSLKNFLMELGLRRPGLAYIHIPKTGGTYLAQLESDKNPVISPIRHLGHVCIVEDKTAPSVYPPEGFTNPHIMEKKELRDYFIVSTVRNPFAFLVSYASHAGGWNPNYRDTCHYDYSNANKSFDYLLKTIADREHPWPSRKFIHFQLFCDSGDFLADWLNRTETLDNDLRDLARYLNINYRKRPKQRIGSNKDYRVYYNDELIDLVRQTWRDELELFGYDFDGIKGGSLSFKRRISRREKESVKYFWKDDCLAIHEDFRNRYLADKPQG